MTGEQRRAAAKLAIPVVGLALGACSPSPDTGLATPSPSVEHIAVAPETPLESLLRIAREQGAHSDQIHILEVAATSGVVTFDQLRTAVEATYQCLDDAGIPYVEDPVDIASSLPVISYRVAVPNSESDRISEACMYRHSFFVESAYQNQPSALDANEAAFTKARPHLIECLNEAGYAVDDTATNDEIKELIVISTTGSGIGSADDPPPGFVPVFCLEGSGIDGF